VCVGADVSEAYGFSAVYDIINCTHDDCATLPSRCPLNCSAHLGYGHCHQVHCCSMLLTYSLYRCLSTPLATATATRSTAVLCFLHTHCTGVFTHLVCSPRPPGPLMLYVSYLLTVQVLVHSAHLGHGHYLWVCCCCVLLTYSLYRCLAVDSSQ